MLELVEVGIDRSDIIFNFNCNNKDTIIDGLKRHDELYGNTTNHNPTNNYQDDVLTQQQANDTEQSNDGRHSVVRLQMN